MDSPCIRACRLTPDRQVCTGCTRTVEEIKNWSRMSDADREAVMRRCLENVWGTKCKSCMALVTPDPLADLPEAPF